MESLHIRSAQGDYPVIFQQSIASIVHALLAKPPTVLVIDARVADLYREQLATLLTAVPHLVMEATEDNKSLRGAQACVEFFQAHGCNRNSTSLAIGGGIIQDICSFSSHIFHRGMQWSFLPTTLLSMSDSCIGAKCCINLGPYKNQLGVFQSPQQVAICPDFLGTLDDREIASGYGEILKLMLTGSLAHFERMIRAIADGGLRNSQLPLLIREALDVKRAIIEVDEYDRGLRQTLNYGHTFGHALEAATGHTVPHGLAVAWGIDVVNHIAERRGLLRHDHKNLISDFIRALLSDISLAPLQATELLEGVKRDKKATDGYITLALLREPGKLDRVKTPIDDLLHSDVQDYLKNYDIFHKS